MITDKDQYQKAHKLTDAEMTRLEKCWGDHTFQGLDEFLSNHPELPNDKFVITEVGSTTTTSLIVQTNGSNTVIFPVKAFSFKGSWDKGTLEYKFFVDLALFDSQKQNGFKQCNKVEPREDGYGIKGIRSARCTFESKPRYLWNPEF